MSTELASFNAFDPVVQNDPWHYYSLLHQAEPVYKDPTTGLMMISGYEHVCEVLKNWEVFSNKFIQAMAGQAVTEQELETARDGGWMPVDTMLTADPPEQRRFRSLVDKAFRPARVRSLEPRMEALSNQFIDSFIADGRTELRESFANLLPMTIIAEQLGVPGDMLSTFKNWSDGFVAQLGGMASADEQVEARKLILEFQKYFATVVEARKADPRDDIISDIANASFEGERSLDMGESLSILQQLLVAGNETTTNSILEGMRLFIENPDQLAKVQADPSLIPNAVEEILRMSSPTANMWRVVTQDTEVGGCPIAKGSMIMLRFGAANRDPRMFPDPARFDIERANANEHIAFGLGIHFCLGANLARRELNKAFEALTARIRNPRLDPTAGPLNHPPNILLYGLESLPIVFDG